MNMTDPGILEAERNGSQWPGFETEDFHEECDKYAEEDY